MLRTLKKLLTDGLQADKKLYNMLHMASVCKLGFDLSYMGFTLVSSVVGGPVGMTAILSLVIYRDFHEDIR